MQEIITVIIVILCIVYIFYSVFKKKKRKDCNCGCDDCKIKELCNKNTEENTSEKFE
jgi:hypothetical protein